jgi:hypothetical protein
MTKTSVDDAHLLAGMAMTHILLFVAFPWTLSADLRVLREVLLGFPTCRCSASCREGLHIDSVLLVCMDAFGPRVVVGIEVVARGTLVVLYSW